MLLSSIKEHMSQVGDLKQAGNALQTYAKSNNSIIHVDLQYQTLLQRYKSLEIQAETIIKEVNIATKEKSLVT